jgi:hypothetical protein
MLKQIKSRQNQKRRAVAGAGNLSETEATHPICRGDG